MTCSHFFITYVFGVCQIMHLDFGIILVKAIIIIKLVLLALSIENKNNQIGIYMVSLGKGFLMMKMMTVLLWVIK